MPNAPSPIDDIVKSKMWQLTESFTEKAFTRKSAKRTMYHITEMISMLRPYFSDDNPNDLRWLMDYRGLYKEVGEIEKIINEEEYLKRISEVELKLYALINQKYQEVFPVAENYITSKVYNPILPEKYDFDSMTEKEINETILKLIEKNEKNLILRTQNAVVNMIKNDLLNEMNDIVLFVGPPGTGKSFAAISLAQAVDPTFNVNRIVMSVDKFFDVFMKEEPDPVTGELKPKFLPPGSAIVIDDAGLGINAREWQSLQAKIFGKLSQAMRFLNHLIILTVPEAAFIEKQTRDLAKIIFEAVGSNKNMDGKYFENRGVFKIKMNKYSPAYNKTLQVYPELTYNHRNIKLKYVAFELADSSLLEAYKIAKEKYLKSTFQEYGHEVMEKTKGKKSIGPKRKIYTEKKTGINLICPKCGYSWNYTGKFSKITRCPSCDARVHIPGQKNQSS